MAIFKCKMCGGDLDIQEGLTICECEYCGTKQTIPALDNEKKLNLFNRANRLRLNSEFDKAASIYENIIAEFPEEAEGYWGLVLCNYGIEYVDDPVTARKIPTCHRAAFESVTKDENYELALEYADVISQKVYRDEAREIDRIMSEILSISKNEAPYDIFICYKETDDAGGRTIDSVIAQDVYDALTDKGYRVFFSRISLEDKLGKQYEPYIFAALNSAKVMLVFGTKYEYFHAVWVKNEWSRFLKLMAKDKSKTLVPCYKDIDPYDMPDEFKPLQAQDMGKVGAIQDLLRGIDKLTGKKESVQQAKETVATAASASKANTREIAYKDGYYIGGAVADQPNGYGTRVWTDGRKYEGEWKFGKMNGQGTMTRGDGSTWIGEFKDDIEWTGKGALFYTDGGKYIGDLVNGNREGYGTYLWSDGKKYEGEWKSDKREGKGTMLQSDGKKYEGEWKSNKRHGKGTLIHKDGSNWTGEFKDGLQWNGKGTFCFYKSGEVYEGELVEGQFEGVGTNIWENGDKYIGDHVNSKRQGYGIYYFADGRKSEGEWKAGQLNGKCTITNKDGSTWIGEFRDGLEWTGKGTICYTDGAVFEGELVNGNREGYGTYLWPDGSKYDGEYKSGKRNGQGTFTNKDGSTWIGEFKDGNRWNGKGTICYTDGIYTGELVNGKFEGNGTYSWPDKGAKYIGEFLNGNPDGYGTFLESDGRKYEGEWKSNKKNGKGTVTNKDGSTWSGVFKDNKPWTGKGTWYNSDGTVLKGRIRNGKESLF